MARSLGATGFSMKRSGDRQRRQIDALRALEREINADELKLEIKKRRYWALETRVKNPNHRCAICAPTDTGD